MPRLDGSAVMGRGLLSWFSDASTIGIVRWLSGAQGSTGVATNKRVCVPLADIRIRHSN